MSAGYSGTPLPTKLGIRDDARVGLVRAPDDVEDLLAPLPPGVRLLRRPRPPLDVVLCFCSRRRDLERDVGRLGDAVAPDGALWIAWPKRSSGVETDMTEDVVREVALPLGLVDNKVCAIDATWSGLRLIWRLSERPARTR
jgi:hypothetical protein